MYPPKKKKKEKRGAEKNNAMQRKKRMRKTISNGRTDVANRTRRTEAYGSMFRIDVDWL